MITEDKDIMLKDILRGMSLDVLDDKALADLGLVDTGLVFGPDLAGIVLESNQAYRLYAAGKLRVVIAKVEDGYRINYVYEVQDSFIKG